MKESPVSSRSMFRHLLAPFAFILAVSVVLIGGLAATAVRNQDQIAIRDSIHLIRSVLADMERRLSDQLLDYTYWDEAVLHLVTTPDPVWADKNVGIYMHDRFGISTSYVLDRNNRAAYSMVGGKRTHDDPFALFSGGLEKIVERTRARPGTEPPVPAAGFLKSGKAVHLVGVSVLTRFKKEGAREKETIATGSILIFTRVLDAKQLGELSKNYLLDDLRLVAAESELLAASLPLKAVNGETLGHLTWQVKSPSESFTPWLLLLLGTVLLVFAGSSYIFVGKAQAAVEAVDRSHAEQRELQERLRQDQEMKDLGLMAGGVAHEFNNLFQGITANLELLQQKYITAAEPKKITSTVLEAAFKGGELTDRLLSYAGQKAINPEVVHLEDYLVDVVKFMRPVLSASIAIEGPNATRHWPVRIDVSQLRASVVNLFLNARDAMPSGGRIHVAIENIHLNEAKTKGWPFVPVPGDYVCLAIKDDGAGMAPAVLERVMQPFYTTKGIGKGTGLGLSMVYGFVTKSNGYIKIDSEVGRGTEVRLFFPWAAENAGAKESDDPSPATKTILYVEDNATVRGALAMAMESSGYRVLSAENGIAALKALDAPGRIDLLLTDIVMDGGISGVELAGRARAMRPGIRIILITAYSEEELSGRHAIQGTGYTVLRKPIQIRALAEAIHQAI